MEYNDSNRGTIQHRRRAKQIINFDGLLYGNKITPTDIDGMMEWHNSKAYVLYEFKYGDTEMPYGQQLALEEMVKDFIHAGKKAIAIVCKHNIANPQEDIKAADTTVQKYYTGEKWFPGKNLSCKRVTDAFWEHVNSEGS